MIIKGLHWLQEIGMALFSFQCLTKKLQWLQNLLVSTSLSKIKESPIPWLWIAEVASCFNDDHDQLNQLEIVTACFRFSLIVIASKCCLCSGLRVSLSLYFSRPGLVFWSLRSKVWEACFQFSWPVIIAGKCCFCSGLRQLTLWKLEFCAEKGPKLSYWSKTFDKGYSIA